MTIQARAHKTNEDLAVTEQDLDEELREMFAVHKDLYDRKLLQAEGRASWRPSDSKRTVNREQMIGMIVEMGDDS
jgi:hypothetical protein